MKEKDQSKLKAFSKNTVYMQAKSACFQHFSPFLNTFSYCSFLWGGEGFVKGYSCIHTTTSNAPYTESTLDFYYIYSCINSLPNDTFLDLSKLKAFADNKINVKQKLKFVLGSLENILDKGENADYQHFLLFPQCFQRASFSWSLKMWIMS